MRLHLIDTLTSWSEVRDCLDLFAGDWIFRGQRDSSWSLVSTVERATSRLPKQLAESLVYREFTRNMHGYSTPNEATSGILEVLALMQHHGAPTRLLDFTYSAYVACFFAIEQATDESASCAVWAIDSGWCKVNGAAKIRAKLGPRHPELASFKLGAATIDPEPFKRIFFDNEKLTLVLPVEPYRRNTRLTVQQGLFLCPGYINAGFEENLGAYDHDEPERHIAKIVIPNRLRAEILRDLNYMNVNRATLFPGIDGFAQSLHHAILHLEDHGQINQRIQKRMKFGKPFQ